MGGLSPVALIIRVEVDAFDSGVHEGAESGP